MIFSVLGVEKTEIVQSTEQENDRRREHDVPAEQVIRFIPKGNDVNSDEAKSNKHIERQEEELEKLKTRKINYVHHDKALTSRKTFWKRENLLGLV